jgi:putative membrane protein
MSLSLQKHEGAIIGMFRGQISLDVAMQGFVRLAESSGNTAHALVESAAHHCRNLSWFAGLFYLPRLFVYHAMSHDEHQHATASRSWNASSIAASCGRRMMMTVVLGTWMAGAGDDYLMHGWLHAKLALVALLVVYHFLCGHFLQAVP